MVSIDLPPPPYDVERTDPNIVCQGLRPYRATQLADFGTSPPAQSADALPAAPYGQFTQPFTETGPLRRILLLGRRQNGIESL